VGRGHPQVARGGSLPPPVAGSISFFFGRSPERQKWLLGVAGSLSPGLWGGSRPLPVAGSFFFFFFLGSSEKSSEMAVGGGVWALGVLIGCFIFILSFCIFLEIMRCQLMDGGQKSLPLRHDCMAAPLISHIYIYIYI
jgi:hypothetical protein